LNARTDLVQTRSSGEIRSLGFRCVVSFDDVALIGWSLVLPIGTH